MTLHKNKTIPVAIIVGIVIITIAVGTLYGDKLGLRSPNSREDRQAIIKIQNELKRVTAEYPAEALVAISYVPEPRTVKTLSATQLAQYETTSIFNIEFKTPWGKGTESPETKDSKFLKKIIFKNGKQLLISFSQGNIKQELVANSGADYARKFEQVLGDKINSNYEFVKFVLSSTPEKVITDIPRAEAEAIAMAVILKAGAIPSLSKSYSFEVPQVKGFQFGDFTGNRKGVTLQFFVPKGDFYGIMAGDSENLTQADVDVIIGTIREK